MRSKSLRSFFVVLGLCLISQIASAVPMPATKTADQWIAELNIPVTNKGYGYRIAVDDVYNNTAVYANYVKTHPVPAAGWFSKPVTDSYWGETFQAFYLPVPKKADARKICKRLGANLATFERSNPYRYYQKIIAPMAEDHNYYPNNTLFALDLFRYYNNNTNTIYTRYNGDGQLQFVHNTPNVFGLAGDPDESKNGYYKTIPDNATYNGTERTANVAWQNQGWVWDDPDSGYAYMGDPELEPIVQSIICKWPYEAQANWPVGQ